MTHKHFLIRRDDWQQCRWADAAPSNLSEGQIEVRVDHVAFTANNISYIKTGDALRYWDFWPAEDGWGRVPCMGFAQVIRSTHADVPEGARIFGWFPLSHTVIMQPDKVSPHGFVESAPNRKGIAPIYNNYTNTSGDPNYAPDKEAEYMLLRGLFLTSFLVDDFMGCHHFFGARTAIVASASSKTAVALAHCLAKRNIHIIGLTSPRNVGFVNSLNLYHQVLTYDNLPQIAADEKAVLVDMAGNGAVINQLHHHLGDNMVYSCLVGATHWDAAPREKELPGAKPEFFFAPGQVERRAAEMGMAALQQQMTQGWVDFRDRGTDWLTIETHRGTTAVTQVYRDTLAGKVGPNQGQILSLWDV